MFHEKGIEVSANPCIEVTQDSEEVVRWDIWDRCLCPLLQMVKRWWVSTLL